MFSKEETEYLQCLELATGIRKIIFCKQKKWPKIMLWICSDRQDICTARLCLLSAKIKTFHLTLRFKRMPPVMRHSVSLKMTKCTYKLNVPQKFKAKLCPAPVPTVTVVCLMSIPTGVGTRTSSSVPVPQLPCSFQPQLTILPVPERSERTVCIHTARELETTVTFMSDTLGWAIKEIMRGCW